MRGTFEIQKPGEVELKLTLYAPASEWRELTAQLGEKWPSWKLSSCLGTALRSLEKVHYGEQKAE